MLRLTTSPFVPPLRGPQLSVSSRLRRSSHFFRTSSPLAPSNSTSLLKSGVFSNHYGKLNISNSSILNHVYSTHNIAKRSASNAPRPPRVAFSKDQRSIVQRSGYFARRLGRYIFLFVLLLVTVGAVIIVFLQNVAILDVDEAQQHSIVESLSVSAEQEQHLTERIWDFVAKPEKGIVLSLADCQTLYLMSCKHDEETSCPEVRVVLPDGFIGVWLSRGRRSVLGEVRLDTLLLFAPLLAPPANSAQTPLIRAAEAPELHLSLDSVLGRRDVPEPTRIAGRALTKPFAPLHPATFLNDDGDENEASDDDSIAARWRRRLSKKDPRVNSLRFMLPADQHSRWAAPEPMEDSLSHPVRVIQQRFAAEYREFEVPLKITSNLSAVRAALPAVRRVAVRYGSVWINCDPPPAAPDSFVIGEIQMRQRPWDKFLVG